ncbi:MAG: T9SS type A sorting domain-containing protein [Bacteroidales bacterium]|nr:T9SS type A sorting domain-containing protein [Bacteroidales bacterium]
MKNILKFRKIQLALFFVAAFLTLVRVNIQAQSPDPDQPQPADWMRGTWGLNWKPGVTANVMQTIKVEDFLNQIKDLKTIDYIQLHINGSGIQTPIHAAPLPVLEALHSTEWDTTLENAMVVPPATDGDNFMVWLKAIKAAGFKIQVYLNGANMMKRHVKKAPCTHLPQYDHPASIPTISEVWKRYCDANFQEFIDSKATHTEQYYESAVVQVGDTTGHPDRKYAFCYAEYVIKAYSEQYGKLIDSWMFDGARNIEGHTGDEPLLYPGDPTHLEAYKAFADAAKAGNPEAIVCFNSGLGADDAINNPYHAIMYDDYTMGHPFNGGNFIGSTEGDFPTHYDQNFFLCTWIADHNGYVFSDGADWQKHILGHWDPPMSTSSWKAGDTPALSNEDFNLWNLTTLQGNGAVSWGVAINDNPPLANDWAIAQLRQGDAYLSVNQAPGVPNWARQATILPEAFVGRAYYHVLTEGKDFWDPEGTGITSLIGTGDELPSWLSITKSSSDQTQWILSGIPNEVASYSFDLRAEDADGIGEREVEFSVLDNPVNFINPGDGSPVWSDTLKLTDATEYKLYSFTLVQGRDFYDFEGDTLTITNVGGTSWLSIEKFSPGIWQIRGYPTESEIGNHTISLSLSDGTHSTTADFQLFVYAIVEYRNVQIKAAAGTNYGIDTMATMISGIHTAPDGLATFQMSIDVMPPAGEAIISGISGGDATVNSWGIGDGTDVNQDPIFRGSDQEWAESINNIQIVNFNANGGELSLTDFRNFSFDSLTIVNAQTGDRDAVAFVVNGDTTDLGIGGISEKTETVSLVAIIGRDSITNFAIGVGDGPQQAINKWAVEGIGVNYDMGLFRKLKVISERGSVQKFPNQTGFRHGTEVKLVPIADEGASFDGWSGDTTAATITGDTIIVVMDADKEILANFPLLTYELNVSTENGAVELSTDQTIYDHGTEVRLIAKANEGYRFNDWSGDTIGATINHDTLTILMNSDKNITVNFSLIPRYTLTVSAVNGAVNIAPDQETFEEGTPVDLSATPDIGYVFDGWSGDLIDTATAVTLVMDADKNVIANFSHETGLFSYENGLTLSVYPNPSKGIFILDIPAETVYTYFVYTITGTKLKEAKVSGKNELDMSRYPNGMYMLKIRSENGFAVKILILE